MERVLAVADNDREFASQLSEYLNEQDSFGFRTVAFTDESSLLDFAGDNQIDVLLCAESLAAPGQADRFNAKRVIVLSEYSYINEQADYPVIFKYQSAKNIMKEILTCYREQGAYSVRREESARLISVCSPSGGCCKSTFALALALQESKRRRTLFISFDPFFTLPFQKKDGSEQGLTDVVYFMEESTKRLDKKVGNVVLHQGGLDYISGVAHWYDLYDFSVERTRLLLDTVVGDMGYECVVIDYGSFDINGMEILLRSDTIYVPQTGKGRENAKFEEWIRQINFVSGSEILEKLRRISIPYDENLDRETFTFENIQRGTLGKFVEEMCCA